MKAGPHHIFFGNSEDLEQLLDFLEDVEGQSTRCEPDVTQHHLEEVAFYWQGSILRRKKNDELFCEVNCDKKKYLRLDLSLTPALPGTNLSVPSLVYFSFKVNVLNLTWLKLLK